MMGLLKKERKGKGGGTFFAIRYGNEFEFEVLVYYEVVLGIKCLEFGFKIYDVYYWFGVLFDGVYFSGCIVEIKCSYFRLIIARWRAMEYYV